MLPTTEFPRFTPSSHHPTTSATLRFVFSVFRYSSHYQSLRSGARNARKVMKVAAAYEQGSPSGVRPSRVLAARRAQSLQSARNQPARRVRLHFVVRLLNIEPICRFHALLWCPFTNCQPEESSI